MSLQDFTDLRLQFRSKVAADFLDHLDADNRWDESKFDPTNDYQRHLYGRFLHLIGRTQAQVWGTIYALSDDVLDSKRQRYTTDVVHSEIVGFPRRNGSFAMMPDQEVEGVVYKDE